MKTLNEILTGFLASDVEIFLSKSQLGLLLLLYHRLYASESQQQDVSESDLENFYQLIDRLESKDPNGAHGKWRPVGGSTGEMVGAALSVLIVLLQAWEEEAVLRGKVEPLRLLFLDEAARLDESSHATLESLSTNMGIQFVVAAPVVAASGKFTHYVLTRKQVGNSRRVFIRGRRRFCEPEHNDSND